MPRRKYARMDVADKLNQQAMNAVNVVKQILEGEIPGGEASNRLGAAKLILNKVVPDLKAVELSGDDGSPLKIELIQYADNPDSK